MKKALTLPLASVLFAGMLAGCGGESSSSGGSSSGDSDQVELKVFIGQPRFKEQYETYIDQFVAKQKEEGRDVTVKLELPSVNEADELLKTRLASGDSPDVFALHAVNDIPVYDKAGYLEDLSGEPFVEKMYDTISPSVTKDDRVLALPLETLQWGYIYNKDLFEEHGVELPQTLTEMKAVVKTFEDADVTPFIRAYKDSYIPQLFLPLTVGALESTTQQGFIEKMNADKGSFADLKDEMFPVIDLVHAHGTDRPFEVGQDQGAAAFAAGEAAMWVQGPWMAESLMSTNPDFNFGVAPMPINDDPNATLIDLSTSTSLAVSKQSEVKDVAKDFVNYVLDEQDSSELYESLGFNPISDVHTFDPYPWLVDSAKYVEEGKVYQDPAIPAAVKSASEKLLQSYYAEDASQDEVVEGLDRAWQEYNKLNK